MEEWLASIGLAGCAAAFQAHGIFREQLGELTDGDLRELGLTIGERKRFLRAILADSSFLDLRTQMPAERRPLSMMFIDLVGSSRLAEQLAPEDLMELLRRYGDFCAAPIVRYGGRIARMVGDGILAYFCFPVANENDPERAVRAALEIARGADALEVPGGEALAVRIGIATGPVVVGDLRTAGGTYRHTVIGSPPNLAARLQPLVPPGGIAISEATFARVRDRFVCAELGSFELRGMSQPYSAWQVLREAPAHGRISRVRPGVMCGRVAELQLLQMRWAQACDGAGGVAVLAGEPGIGKSRLLQTFLQDSEGEGEVATILLEGSALETDSVLRPVSAWLQRIAAAGGEEMTGEPTGLSTALRDWPACAPALSGLLGTVAGGADAAPQGTPEQVREATLAALTRLVLAQAEDGPLRLVMEDLHWFDPTSLELVARLAGAVAGRRVLMLLTVRPDFEAGPVLPDDAVRLDLRRLDEGEVAALAGSMLAGRPVTPALLRAIHRKADGVPLFVEEVVRTLVARGQTDAAEPAELAIPASVHELLAGRLDRLGEAKEIAQAAAVIGRDVPREVLARVCAAQFGTPDEVLAEALDLLVGAGVLSEGADGRRAGAFTHALLRDAAYASLLRGPCQALHRRVAQAMLECDPQAASVRPELMALHLTEGADPLASLPYWLTAARLALSRSALLEATRLLGRGLAALDALPRTSELIERRLEFMTLLGPPLMALKGYGSAEAMRLYAEANALAEQLPETARHFPIYFGWWRVSRDYDHKLERAHALLSRARKRRDPELLLQAHHCAWASEFFVGNYARSGEHVRAGLAIYDRHDVRHHMHLYGGHDAKVCGHGELALVHWMMGRPVSAREQDRLSRGWADNLDHAGSMVHNRENRLYRHAWCRNLDLAAEESDELMRLAAEHGMEDVRAKSLIFLGWAVAKRSDPVAGRRLLEDGMERQRDIGTNEDFPVYVSLLAEILIAAGEAERAVEVLRQTELEFDRTGLWFWRSEMRRMQAEALVAIDARDGNAELGDPVRQLFADAIRIAEEQGAAMLGLRAAAGLARIDPHAAALRGVEAWLGAVVEDDGGVDVTAARRLLREHDRRRGEVATSGGA